MMLGDLFLDEIHKLLKRVPEPRGLCVFPRASLLVSLTVPMAELNAHGSILGIYEPHPWEFPQVEAVNWLVLLRAHPEESRLLNSFIDLLSSKGRNLDHVFAAYIPNKGHLSLENICSPEQIQRLTVLECWVCFAQLEKRLLSLELDNSFSEIYIQNDLSSVSELLNGIKLIEAIYQPAQNYIGKGEISRTIIERILEDKERGRIYTDAKNKVEKLINKEGEVLEAVILIDRTVDPISPICIQTTYHGMLDEILGVDTSDIKVKRDKSTTVDEKGPQKENTVNLKKGFFLNSEVLDSSLPGMKISRASSFITSASNALFEDYMIYKTRSLNTPNEQLLPEIHGLRVKYGQVVFHSELIGMLEKSVNERIFSRLHKTYEDVMRVGVVKGEGLNKVESMIHMAAPGYMVLRLLSFCSLMEGGIPVKKFNALRQLISDVRMRDMKSYLLLPIRALTLF